MRCYWSIAPVTIKTYLSLDWSSDVFISNNILINVHIITIKYRLLDDINEINGTTYIGEVDKPVLLN